MIFSKRYKLAKEFEKWCEETGSENHPLNVITYLDIKGHLKDGMPIFSPQGDGEPKTRIVKSHDIQM